MSQYKIVADGYIEAIGVGKCPLNGTEIEVDEYNAIRSVIRNKPSTEPGYDYTLNETLEWEQIEVPIIDELDMDIPPEEALSIILGGAI